MSKLEPVPGPGSTDLPDCICGREMSLSTTQLSPKGPDTGLRSYSCVSSGHKLRLTVWTNASLEEPVTGQS